MFAVAQTCEFDLIQTNSNGATQRFNPWLYLPHTLLYMSGQELVVFLRFLRGVKKLNLDGRVFVHAGTKVTVLTIRGTQIADVEGGSCGG
jgi:hypothetical protein